MVADDGTHLAKLVKGAVRAGESEGAEFLDILFGHAPTGLFAIGPDGAILSVNPAACAMLGYTEAELVGRTVQELTHPEDVDQTRVRLQALREAASGVVRFEKRYLDKQGRTVWAAVSSQATPGGQVAFVTHIEDITERKRAENALRENEEKFRIAFENAPLGMSMIHPDGGYIAVNEALCRMFGYTREELLAGTINRITHPDDVEASMRWIRKMASGDQSEPEIEKRYIHKDGHVLWGLVRSQWVKNEDGTPRLSVTHVLDITARKEAELATAQRHQAQKMEALGYLAGGIAHDFNNLLTAMGGNAELALEAADAERRARHLREVLKGVAMAADLTRRLLTFSRKQPVDPRILDFNEVVVQTTQMLKRLLREDLDFQTRMDPELGRARFDLSQLEQILINLVVNARDAMPRGGKLTIETSNVLIGEGYARIHPDVLPGPYVLLAVSDNGTGMTEETRRRIFEPFYTTKEPGQGTGLGLAMVYGAVRQNQGHIEVYSELGLGSTFKIYLPRVDLPADSLSPETRAPAARGDERVMIVEDDPMVAAFAAEALTGKGYRVVTCANGPEALRALGQAPDPVELVIVDVVMPTMSGREFAELAMALRPGLRVLFASGYSQNVIERHGVLEPGLNFLPKPYSLEALAHKVRAMLD